MDPDVLERLRGELNLAEDTSEAEVLVALQKVTEEMIHSIGIMVAMCAARLEQAIHWDGQVLDIPKPNIVRMEILDSLTKCIENVNEASKSEFKSYVIRLKEVVDNFALLAEKL